MCVISPPLADSSVTSLAVRFLQCSSVAGHSVVFSAPLVECRGDAYDAARVLMVALLVFPGLLFPVVVVVGLWQVGAARRSDDAFGARWGFFYQSFTPQCYWWTGVDLLRRTALVLVTVLGVSDPVLQAQLHVLICGVQALLQTHWRPFAMAQLNYLETASLFLLLLVSVLNMGLAAQSDPGAVPWSAQLALTLLVAVPLLLLGAWVVGRQLRDWWVRVHTALLGMDAGVSVDA